MSDCVTGAWSAPDCAKRSPQKRADVDSSFIKPHSHECGTCGVSNQRTECLPRLSNSPLASTRGGRSARSLIETIAPIVPHSGTDCGATPSHSCNEPHSSASTMSHYFCVTLL